MNEPIHAPKGLPKELYEDFQFCAADPDLAIQSFFRIRNIQGQLVQFVFNRAQRLLAERSKGRSFAIVLKARKVGVSSRRFGEDLWKCATQKHQHRILLTHDDDAAGKLLYEKIMPLHDNSLIPLGGVIKKTDGMIYFPNTDSRYYVGTAGNKRFGRGDDITGRHFSEQAWWASPDVITGVDEAMVEGGDGLTETTANGYNFFKTDWERAKRGESRDVAIFLPWMVHELYEADANGLVTTGAEKEVMDALGLSPRQLAWRRKKINDMRDPALFPQEYPETDQQAFLSSGRPVFDWVGLSRAQSHCSKPLYRGYLRRIGNRIDLVEDAQGPLKIWKVPEHKHIYGIGGDVAEGIEGNAYSAGFVLDIGNGSQVAEWHGHISPDLFGDELVLLSAYYNQAVIAPESYPGPGGTTEARIAELEGNLWQDPDKNSERGGTMGWRTNMRSKPLMIHALNAAIRDRELILKSQDLLDECHAYVYSKDRSHINQMSPSIGQFSDRLIAAAIIWYVTRDMAMKIDYDRAPRVSEIGRQSKGGTSVPKFQGPRLGVHRND